MQDLWHLSGIDWLGELSPEELDALERGASRRRYAAGEIVFRPTGQPHSVYLLEDGRVRIYRLSPDGAEVSLGYIAPGEVFGELAAFGDFQRESHAEAAAPSSVYRIQRAAFETALAARPSLVFEVTKQIGRRLKRIENRVEDLVFRNSRARIARVLSELADTEGQRDGGRVVLDLPITQEEIAKLVGSTRQTVNETLRQLQAEGVIAYGRRKIEILRPEVLRSAAEPTPRD